MAKKRAQIVPQAEGRILEIGFGSGNNSAFYDAAKINHLFALEPNIGWRRLGEKRLKNLPFSAEWIDLPGEQIPLDDESVDTVLVTFSLCTIPGIEQALAGMRRVLKPGGKLLFLEHGRAPDHGVAKWQERVNNVWGKLAGGCHLNREPDLLLRNAGFQIVNLEQGYLPKTPKMLAFLSSGVASR